MADIQGFCNAPFEKLTDVLSGTVDDGGDLGASVAVTLEGEPVADFGAVGRTRGARRPGSGTRSSTSGRRPRR